MSSVLYKSPIFGPIHSRRLGLSLGINLLPADRKICSFDCLYCECGLNGKFPSQSRMPSREEIAESLRKTMLEMHLKNASPDTLTFAGNGEPTMHPEFPDIVNDTIMIRNQYAPQAKISVLSNAAHLHKESVFQALLRVDNALLKLDTVNPDYIRLIDRPNISVHLPILLERLKAFNGQCIIQTMFLKGRVSGIDVNNTTDQYVLPWIDALKAIRPKLVTIYTLDRETPITSLQKASHTELDRIATLLAKANISCSVSY